MTLSSGSGTLFHKKTFSRELPPKILSSGPTRALLLMYVRGTREKRSQSQIRLWQQNPHLPEICDISTSSEKQEKLISLVIPNLTCISTKKPSQRHTIFGRVKLMLAFVMQFLTENRLIDMFLNGPRKKP